VHEVPHGGESGDAVRAEPQVLLEEVVILVFDRALEDMWATGVFLGKLAASHQKSNFNPEQK
jgi:hypothetical protein